MIGGVESNSELGTLTMNPSGYRDRRETRFSRTIILANDELLTLIETLSVIFPDLRQSRYL